MTAASGRSLYLALSGACSARSSSLSIVSSYLGRDVGRDITWPPLPARTTMDRTEPCFDVAHLGHVELLTDKPEASLDFFVNVLGLSESGREGDSVYLRGWDDYEFHTLKLTAAKTTGMRHVGY